jgi:NADH dehydrogenase
MEDLASVVEDHRPEAIVNFLGILKECPEEGVTFERVNLDYTHRLLEGAAAAGTRRFVQISALGADASSRSRYLRTKGLAEDALAVSGLEWAALRPSVIVGPGQKFFDDLRGLARFAPVLPAPSDRLLQPVALGDAAECAVRALEDEVKGEVFELCGPETMSYAEFFRASLRELGIRRPVLGLPRSFFAPALPLLALLPDPPMTRDQYRMTAADNVFSGKYRGAADLLGRDPVRAFGSLLR